jgi:predicted DCC family thiol-disulfide oxidoreductase YuxK
VRGRDKASRVLVLPNQIPNLIGQYGLSRAQVDREVWAVAPDGTRWSGAAAINRTLQELDSAWAWVAAIYHLAFFRWIEDRAYRWVAEHRTWLSRWLGAPPEWKD